MGNGRWDSDAWSGYTKTTATKTVDKIYTSTRIHKTLDPKGVTVRESRDSTEHPESNAIIVALDETGSMGMLAETIAKKNLGVMVEEILKRKPVVDPQTMIMMFGDVRSDRSPLQVSQFESSNVLTEQLELFFLEGNGGGNSSESYDFPWYFAAQHTSIDCFEKRNKRGYLFTIGDENAPYGLRRDDIKRFIGDDPERDFSPEELLVMAQRCYHVFHIVAEEGSHCRSSKATVYKTWKELLGQNVLPMSDHTKLAEIIVSTIQITEGADKKVVSASWDGTTNLVVANAVKGLPINGKHTDSGVVTLS